MADSSWRNRYYNLFWCIGSRSSSFLRALLNVWDIEFFISFGVVKWGAPNSILHAGGVCLGHDIWVVGASKGLNNSIDLFVLKDFGGCYVIKEFGGLPFRLSIWKVWILLCGSGLMLLFPIIARRFGVVYWKPSRLLNVLFGRTLDKGFKSLCALTRSSVSGSIIGYLEHLFGHYMTEGFMFWNRWRSPVRYLLLVGCRLPI